MKKVILEEFVSYINSLTKVRTKSDYNTDYYIHDGAVVGKTEHLDEEDIYYITTDLTDEG
jgi:hypothetical protein